MGEVLHRLTSKYLSRIVQQEAVRFLSPLQLGVSIKAGCEAIVHSVSRVMETPDVCWTLLLNFSNAFNCVDRSALFEKIQTRIPCPAPWMECCYGVQSAALHFWDVIIPSCSSVQQGDPLGPLGFSLALQPLVESVKAKVPDLNINVWYLDDGIPYVANRLIWWLHWRSLNIVALQEVYF